MSQLDRLAAMLHDIGWCDDVFDDDSLHFRACLPADHHRHAHALVARGVMVVDTEVLENALRTLPEYAETPSYRRHAIDLLAALIMGGVA